MMKLSIPPTLASRIHLFLNIQELLLLLLSIIFFAILSSARLFSLVFPLATRFYFYHDKSFAFYAVLLLLFFICSTSIGILYTKWRKGTPIGENGKIPEVAFVSHPISWHLSYALFKPCSNIFLSHAVLLSLPCLLLQLYVRGLLFSTGESTLLLFPLKADLSSSSTSSKVFFAISTVQLSAIFTHVINYILCIRFFVISRWIEHFPGSKASLVGSEHLQPLNDVEGYFKDNETKKRTSGDNSEDPNRDIGKESDKNKDTNINKDTHIEINKRDTSIQKDRGIRNWLARLESNPRHCIEILLFAWAALVIFTLPNVLQLFARGKQVAAVVLALTFNVLPIPLIINNKSCLQSPMRNLFILAMVIFYELLSNAYLWSVFTELGVNNNINHKVNNNLNHHGSNQNIT